MQKHTQISIYNGQFLLTRNNATARGLAMQ